jgi:hypothetical protein
MEETRVQLSKLGGQVEGEIIEFFHRSVIPQWFQEFQGNFLQIFKGFQNRSCPNPKHYFPLEQVISEIHKRNWNSGSIQNERDISSEFPKKSIEIPSNITNKIHLPLIKPHYLLIFLNKEILPLNNMQKNGNYSSP